MRQIFVVGSINTDLSMAVDRLPRLGESVYGQGYMQTQGGKGANQAVACAKLGCPQVYLVGAVGADADGEKLRACIAKVGVDTGGVTVKPQAGSGVCVALSERASRDNVLIVCPGANDALCAQDVEEFLRTHARAGDILLVQLEIPHEAVLSALRCAKEMGMRTVLNPAPVRGEIGDLLRYVDFIVPNETEFASLTGCSADGSGLQAGARALHAAGAGTVIVTLGKRGSVCVGEETFFVDAVPAEAIDTTAAGDTFLGAFCTVLARGGGVREAMEFGARCAAVTVTRRGAAESIPFLRELSGK